MKITGIYCIENKVNGKKYIGQSQNCNKRIQTHITSLRKNKDSCIYLQRAWNIYGENNFTYSIIEECLLEEINEKEIYYIKELNSHCSENGYNISWGGVAPMRNRKHTSKTKEKMKNSQLGDKSHRYGKPMLQETKDKLSKGRLGSLHWNYGKHHKKETIEKMKKNNAHNKHTFTKEEKIHQRDMAIGKNKSRKTSTKYIGVTFHKAANKWRARMSKGGKEMHLGLFEFEVDAARAYDKFCWNEYHRKDILNFPNEY